jgi:hypothetical protein
MFSMREVDAFLDPLEEMLMCEVDVFWMPVFVVISFSEHHGQMVASLKSEMQSQTEESDSQRTCWLTVGAHVLGLQVVSIVRVSQRRKGCYVVLLQKQTVMRKYG